ncbi:hypothetical protein H5410_020858, partial [Solanum commersonii]
SPSPVDESLIGLDIAFCSNVLSPKGEGQFYDQKEKSERHQAVPQSSISITQCLKIANPLGKLNLARPRNLAGRPLVRQVCLKLF